MCSQAELGNEERSGGSIMGRLGFCLSVGVLLMVLGAFPLFCLYGFATMGPPEREGPDWATVLSSMFNFADAGMFSVLGSVSFLGGAGLFLYGIIASIADGIRWVWRTK